MEGILIDIRLGRAKVLCLLTTNRRKLSRQDANCVSGNSVGKTITETFPAVGLDVWNTVLCPAQLYFVPGLTLRSTKSRRLGLSTDSFGIGLLRTGSNTKDDCSEQKNSQQFIAIKECHYVPQ